MKWYKEKIIAVLKETEWLRWKELAIRCFGTDDTGIDPEFTKALIALKIEHAIIEELHWGNLGDRYFIYRLTNSLKEKR